MDLLTQTADADAERARNAMLLAVGLLIGVAIAYRTAKAVILARIATEDYRSTKAKVPVLKKLMYALWRTAVGRIILSAVFIGAVLMVAVGPTLLR